MCWSIRSLLSRERTAVPESGGKSSESSQWSDTLLWSMCGAIHRLLRIDSDVKPIRRLWPEIEGKYILCKTN